MGIDHKRPMYAFVAVALLCGLVIADQVRSEALNAFARHTVVAGTTLNVDLPAIESLLPDAEPEQPTGPAAPVVEPVAVSATTAVKASSRPTKATPAVHHASSTHSTAGHGNGNHQGAQGNGPRTPQQQTPVEQAPATPAPATPVVPTVPVVDDEPKPEGSKGPKGGWVRNPHTDSPASPQHHGPWTNHGNGGKNWTGNGSWVKPSWSTPTKPTKPTWTKPTWTKPTKPTWTKPTWNKRTTWNPDRKSHSQGHRWGRTKTTLG